MPFEKQKLIPRREAQVKKYISTRFRKTYKLKFSINQENGKRNSCADLVLTPVRARLPLLDLNKLN
jgi:hypothetical protein